MYLLPSYSISLFCALAAMLLLSGWIITYKASKWRFEFYYIDFILGFVLISLAAFATLGTFATGITSLDNIGIASARRILVGIAAGCIVSLTIMLQLALASLAGIALSLMITASIAFCVNYFALLFAFGRGYPVIVLGASFLALVAAGLAIAAFTAHTAALNAALLPASAGSQKPRKQSGQAPEHSSVIGILLGIGGGLVFGFLLVAVRLAHFGDLQLEAYPIAVLTALGALLSAPVYELFFLNLPIGPSHTARLSRYLKGTRQQHLLSLAGGFMFGGGYLLLLMAMYAATPIASLPAVHGAALTYGAALPAAFYGLVALRELRNGNSVILAYLSLLCFFAALSLSLFAE